MSSYIPTPDDDRGVPLENETRKAVESAGWSIDDFLADYRPVERVISVAMRGDLIGKLAELETKLDAARETSESGGLGDSSNVMAIAENITDLRDRVRESARTFRVSSIGDRAWSDLLASHPPTKEQKAEGNPWNPETFFADALARTVVEPQMTIEQADKLMEVLSAGQLRKLVSAVIEVNGGGDDLPKSDAPFVLQQHSTPKRNTAARGASHDPFSLDG